MRHSDWRSHAIEQRAEAAQWRQQRVLVLTGAKPQGPLYNSTAANIEAIAGLAEVVTGDQCRFYQRDATAAGETLPPVKWRTVE